MSTRRADDSALDPGGAGPHTLLRAVTVLLAAALLVSTAAGTARSAPRGHGDHRPDVAVSVSPDSGLVPATSCGAQVLEVKLTNDGDEPFYTDVFLSAESPLRLNRSMVSSYFPPGHTVATSVKITAIPDAEPGTYRVTVDGGREPVRVPVTVASEPPDGSANLARFAEPSASSTNRRSSVCGAIDGNRSQQDWRTWETGWNDGTAHEFPDWYRLDLAQPERVGSVELVTVDRPDAPASLRGLRDFDVQVRLDGTWRTVAEVRGNEQGVVRSTFAPVTTSAVRLYIYTTGDGFYSRIIELEVYAG